MSLPRIIVDRIPTAGALLRPPLGEARHLKVRRVAPGDKVTVLDGCGKEAQGTLEATGEIRVEAVRENLDREPPLSLTLFTALLKGYKMDFLIQKVTELGVKRLVPLVTGRSVAKPTRRKLERWCTISREALKQCGGTVLPTIEPPRKLEEIIPEGEKGWVLWEGEKTDRLSQDSSVRKASLVVGPEGGWKQSEMLLLFSRGFTPATLGPRIFRAETAAIVGAALLLWGNK